MQGSVAAPSFFCATLHRLSAPGTIDMDGDTSVATAEAATKLPSCRTSCTCRRVVIVVVVTDIDMDVDTHGDRDRPAQVAVDFSVFVAQ